MKKLPIILIAAGILAILGPLAGKLYIQYQEYRMINEWLNSEDLSTPEPSASADPAEAFGQLQDAFAVENRSQAPTDSASQDTQGRKASATPKPTAKPAVKPVVKQVVLGLITIDKLKLKYPVVEGVKPENLRSGIGHIPGTAVIGQPGNCALAGHRNYTFGKFFNRLDELEIGDKVVLKTKTDEYRYIVYEKLVVKPDDVSVIKANRDDNIITLITCTPIYIATHRLIIHARLESRTVEQP